MYMNTTASLSVVMLVAIQVAAFLLVAALKAHPESGEIEEQSANWHAASSEPETHCSAMLPHPVESRIDQPYEWSLQALTLELDDLNQSTGRLIDAGQIKFRRVDAECIGKCSWITAYDESFSQFGSVVMR